MILEDTYASGVLNMEAKDWNKGAQNLQLTKQKQKE